VRELAQWLSMRGYSSAVAAPGIAPAAYVDESLSVYCFACDARPRLELAYGVPDEIAGEGFRAIVAQARPDIVHSHSRTAARLVDVAHAAGARVIFTCAHGELRARHDDAVRRDAMSRYHGRETLPRLRKHWVCRGRSWARAAIPNTLYRRDVGGFWISSARSITWSRYTTDAHAQRSSG
jgi:hypothetical protein